MFNETLRQNVLSIVSGVFDIYTFEDFTTQMNDGHTRTSCYHPVALFAPLFCCQLVPKLLHYLQYHSVRGPAPIVLLDKDVIIAPNSVGLLNQYDQSFASYLIAKGFDWKRLAGAKVIEIGGPPALDYIDKIARTVCGQFA